MRYRWLLALLVLSSGAYAQTVDNPVTKKRLESAAFDPNVAGTWDFNLGTLRVYGGTGDPDATRCNSADEERSLYIKQDTGEIWACFDYTAGWAVATGGTGGTGDVTGVGSCASGSCFSSVAANLILAGPASGGAAAATPRTLVDDDIPDSVTIAPTGSAYIDRPGSKVLDVCKSGCKYTTICGMTVGGASGSNCSTGSNATCIAGSAIRAIKDAGDYSQATPYVVKVGAGVYNECVAFDNISDVALVGEGQDKVIVRPTVTTALDVDNGVLRVGNGTATINSTTRIEVSGITFWNDAFGAPEAGCEVGADAGPTNGVGASWNDIYFHDMRCIGNHDGQQIFGSRLTTDGDVPRFLSKNVRVISGADSAAVKGFVNASIINMDALSQTNWCESTDTAHLVTSTGTIASGTSTTVFTLPATETTPNAAPSSTNDFYVGRRILLAGTGCTAGNKEGDIIDYNGSTRAITVGAALGFTPAATCTYTLYGVANYETGNTLAKSPCTDIDWSVIRGSQGANYVSYWKNTGFHFGVGNGQSSAPDSAVVRVQGSRFVVNVNDFGPPNGAAATCSAQSTVDGILAYNSRWQDAYIDNATVEVNVNTDLSQQTTGCAYQINGVALIGTASFDGAMNITNSRITVNNAGDPNANVSAIVVDSSATASTLNISNVQAYLNVTAAGYVGTETYLVQASDEVLNVSGLESPEAITTSGTITSGNSYAGTGVYHGALSASNLSGTNTGDDDVPDANEVTGAAISLSSEAIGNIMYYDGTDWVRLINGAAGTVLESGGVGSIPAWGTDDTGGGGANSFQTIDAPAGTDPVADSSTDTLAIVATSPVTVTGADNPESLTIAVGDAAAGSKGIIQLAGDLAGTAAAPVVADNSVDGTDIALGSDAAGDVMYYDGTNWVRLPKGTAGQVLEMNAGATAPEWDTDDTGGGGLTVEDEDVALSSESTINFTGTGVECVNGTGQYDCIIELTPPGGSNTEVQFNASGVFDGDPNFTFTAATGAVFVGGTLTVGGGADGTWGLTAKKNTIDLADPGSGYVIFGAKALVPYFRPNGGSLAELVTVAGSTMTGDLVFGANTYPKIASGTATTGTDCDAAGEAGRLFLDTNDDTDGTVYFCRGAAGWKDIDDDGAAGGAIKFDIGDDSGDDSVAVNEIATTGDTNSIFTESSADKILIAVGNPWPKADALTNNPSDCGANTFATTIAANGDLTCAQPAFSGLTGTPKQRVAAGATPTFLGAKRYYILGEPGNDFLLAGQANPASSTLYVYPFLQQRTGTVDEIEINVSTAATGTSQLARCGIWENKSDTDPYPDTLLFDSGQISTASIATVNQPAASFITPSGTAFTLTQGKLYWAGCSQLSGTARATISARASFINSAIFGYAAGTITLNQTSTGFSTSSYTCCTNVMPAGSALTGGVAAAFGSENDFVGILIHYSN